MEEKKKEVKKKNKTVCDKCGAVFSHSQKLSRHRLMCLQEVFYECLCAKKFNRIDNFKRHVAICDGERKIWNVIIVELFLNENST